tara:strand:+ start:931 stop:1179 length:249 start_codon:yes stop_codon:yes gene_type:complete
MPEKPEYDYQHILDNFEQFCDGFESAAAEGYLRGNEKSPILSQYTTRHRTDTPRIVSEVSEYRGEGIESRKPSIDVQATNIE